MLIAITVAARAHLPYAAAGCWALTGIAVTGFSDGTTAVAVTSIVAAVALAGATLLPAAAPGRR